MKPARKNTKVMTYEVPPALWHDLRKRDTVYVGRRPVQFTNRIRGLLGEILLEHLLGNCPDRQAAAKLLEPGLYEDPFDHETSTVLVLFEALLEGRLR